MPDRCVILCMGRTGSQLLVELLDSHPDIECKGELFGPNGDYGNALGARPGLSRKEYLRNHAFDTAKRTKCFKMPCEWITSQPGVFEDLAALGYAAIILSRANALEHFISMHLAMMNGDWTSRSEYRVQSLCIDPWEFVQFVGARTFIYGTLKEIARDMGQIHLSYENLLAGEEQLRLFRFLGVEPAPLATKTVRCRSQPLHSVVENYRHLAAFFRNSPFADLFPEVPSP